MDSIAELKFTVYVRLPFPRGDFVDPPSVNWNPTKDEALWKILSGVAKADIDWNELAARFEVTVDFLLQQVAYLTEHHTSQIRAQIHKATVSKGSNAPSPVPGSDSAAAAAEAIAMRRTGSGGGRAPSALSIRKDSPLPRADANIPGTPIKTSLARANISRNSSANTTVVRNTAEAGGGGTSSVQRPGQATGRPGVSGQDKRRSTKAGRAGDSSPEAEPPSPGPAESSSANSSDDDNESSPAQSRIIRRPPRFHQHQRQDDAASPLAGEDDEAEPAFLPFKEQDMAATLRGDPRDYSKRLPSKSAVKKKAAEAAAQQQQQQTSQTSDSSASSAAFVQSARPLAGERQPPNPPAHQGPISPRRTAELAGRSPATKGKGKGKGKGYSQEGSDGTPSMGSSFSDLDDASVTQSALEEALASKMQDGGTIGSRMSTFSQAFSRRYLPKANRP